MAAILDFRSARISYFDLQVTPMLPTKFGVNWPFGSGEEAKNKFSRWRLSWISDRIFFFIYKSPRCFVPSLRVLRKILSLIGFLRFIPGIF